MQRYEGDDIYCDKCHQKLEGYVHSIDLGEPYHFCSLECLIKYIMTLVVVQHVKDLK